MKIDGDVWDALDRYSRESGVRKKHVATEGVRKELERRTGETTDD